MEPQKSSAGAAQNSTTYTTAALSPHSMMQSFFTAAALQQGTRLPTTPSTPLGPLPQQLYTPSNLFLATMPAATTAYPPLFTYPGTSPIDLMAAAAQIHAARQTANHS